MTRRYPLARIEWEPYESRFVIDDHEVTVRCPGDPALGSGAQAADVQVTVGLAPSPVIEFGLTREERDMERAVREQEEEGEARAAYAAMERRRIREAETTAGPRVTEFVLTIATSRPAARSRGNHSRAPRSGRRRAARKAASRSSSDDPGGEPGLQPDAGPFAGDRP